jgi:threonine aldolase
VAIDPERVPTNILYFDITRDDVDPPVLIERMRDHGVLGIHLGPRRVRLVTHLDVSREDVERAGHVIERALAGS